MSDKLDRIKGELSELYKSIKETATEDYSAPRAMSDAVRLLDADLAIVGEGVEILQFCVSQIISLHDHVRELYRIIDELAPEYTIIETMAETEEERRAMCDAYMNHGVYATSTTDTEHEKADPLP